MASLEDQRDAYRVGLNRHAAARARGGVHKWNWDVWGPDEATKRDIDGQSAVAEMLVAEATGRRWLSDGNVPDAPLAGDVEGGLQVRWTEHLHGHLIVHDEDPDGLIAVLVVGRAPNMQAIGWINCIEAKTPLYWREPPKVNAAAFFVPQSALLDIYLLRKAIGAAVARSPGTR